MATNERPKDTLGDKPRFVMNAPAQPPTPKQQDIRKAMITRRLQNALRELDAAYKQAGGGGYKDLSKAIIDAKANIGREVVKLSGPVISLGELVG